jgi:glycosyltransferase involved in cell wall biosynthesis
MGGSETYVRALTRELASLPDIDLVVLVPTEADALFQGARTIVVPGPQSGGSAMHRLRTLARTGHPWAAARRSLEGASVVHYPLTVPVPMGHKGTPMVQTVHDVQHHDLPELFSRAELAYRSVGYDRPARRADTVITISQFCKDRLVTQLGLQPDRIVVAHLGVDVQTFTPYDGPREPFVLYPARGWPHKNHERLVAAVALLRMENPDLRLILTGGRGSDLGLLPEWVEHRGLVPESELRKLYRSAACLAFPSLYEGFGLPPLEAMASSCPVAAATSGALPEVCGDAAIMFDPLDVPAMAAAVSDAIASRERLVPLGIQRARCFTWQACAEVHAGVYRRVAGHMT